MVDNSKSHGGLSGSRLEYLVAVIQRTSTRDATRAPASSSRAAAGSACRRRSAATARMTAPAAHRLGLQPPVGDQGLHQRADAARRRARPARLHDQGLPHHPRIRRVSAREHHRLSPDDAHVGTALVFMRPGMYIDQLDEVIAAICKLVHSTEEPGRAVHCAADGAACPDGRDAAAHGPAGPFVPRHHGRGPAAAAGHEGYRRGAAGRPARAPRGAGVRGRFSGPAPRSRRPRSHGAFLEERAEMPWVGMVSTAPDMHRFAEMLRRAASWTAPGSWGRPSSTGPRACAPGNCPTSCTARWR